MATQAADGAFTASLAGFALFSPQNAPSAGALAADLAAVLLPYTLVAPFTGVLLDRRRRRNVLIGTALARAVVVSLVALLVRDARQGAAIGVAIGVLALSRFALSALSAALPLTVDPAQLVAATALTGTAGTAASLVGAALDAAVRVAAGSSPGGQASAVVVAAGMYVAAAAVASRAGAGAFGPASGDVPTAGGGRDARRVASEITAGAAQLWRHRTARLAVAGVNAGRVCYGYVFVALVLLTRHPERPGTGLRQLAVATAALAAGTLGAAFVAAPLARSRGRIAVLSAALVAAGATTLVFAGAVTRPAPSDGVLVVSCLLLGLCAQTGKICSDAVVAGRIDDAARGRAFVVLDLAFNASYVLAACVAALTLPADGRSARLLGVAGAAWMLAGVLVARLSAARSRRADRLTA